MQIISLEAENIKRLKAIRIDSDGKPIVEIGGKNEAGKSTVLDTISYCLGGKGEVDEVPIRKGKKKARAAIDLGEPTNLKYRVTRVFTPKNKGGSVEVTSAEGAVYKSPQALLDGFISDLTFSPLDFMTSKDQAGMILKVSQIPFIADELAAIAGLQSATFITDNPFDAIRLVSKGIYDQRHEAGQEVIRCEGVFNGIKIPEGMEDTQPVKVAELFAERQGMEQQQVKNSLERNKVNTMARAIETKETTATEIRKTINDLANQITRFKTQLGKTESEIVEANALLLDQKQLTAELVDPAFEEIDQRLKEADYVNIVATDVKRKKEAEATLLTAQGKHRELDNRLTSVREYREDLLQKTIFPVEGLSFDESGTVTFEGLPLSQRGTSKQIQVGLDILAALNPKLRVVLVKDANDFDSNNIEIVRMWAIKKKFQVWMERVQDEPGKVAFYIEDGELKE